MGGFKVGDVVQLKSGGQKMTVRETVPPEPGDADADVEQAKSQPAATVRCQWIAGGRLCDACFPSEMLKKGDDEGGPVQVVYVDVERLPARGEDVAAKE